MTNFYRRLGGIAYLSKVRYPVSCHWSTLRWHSGGVRSAPRVAHIDTEEYIVYVQSYSVTDPQHGA